MVRKVENRKTYSTDKGVSTIFQRVGVQVGVRLVAISMVRLLSTFYHLRPPNDTQRAHDTNDTVENNSRARSSVPKKKQQNLSGEVKFEFHFISKNRLNVLIL